MKSVRSIQNQSFKNIELIIFDDCPTDRQKIFMIFYLKLLQVSELFIIQKIWEYFEQELMAFYILEGNIYFILTLRIFTPII